MRDLGRLVPAVAFPAALLLLGSPALAQTEYLPHTPAQMVGATMSTGRSVGSRWGNGDVTVTDDETGPGGWRFNRLGQSFVTFAYTWNPLAPGYDVVAGRSGVALNAAIVNDYPAALDLPQAPDPDQLVFRDHQGEIVLTGDTSTDPPAFKLSGRGPGEGPHPHDRDRHPPRLRGLRHEPAPQEFRRDRDRGR